MALAIAAPPVTTLRALEAVAYQLSNRRTADTLAKVLFANRWGTASAMAQSALLWYITPGHGLEAQTTPPKI